MVYRCACGSTFARVDGLQRHRRNTKTPELCRELIPVFECGCGKSFGRWQNFKDHANSYRADAVCSDSLKTAEALATRTVTIVPAWPSLGSAVPPFPSSMDSTAIPNSWIAPPSDSTTSNLLLVKCPVPGMRVIKGAHSWIKTDLVDGSVCNYTQRRMRDTSMSTLPDESSASTHVVEFYDTLNTSFSPEGRLMYSYAPETDFKALYDQLKAGQTSKLTPPSGSLLHCQDYDHTLDLIEDSELNLTDFGYAEVIEDDESESDATEDDEPVPMETD
ncbi:hypothetical protein FRC11_009196 [Ceratobasidium sp. 423]|nr:hypothetical protein FRC11_009196 [Ceratobasidium sp. 423]